MEQELAALRAELKDARAFSAAGRVDDLYESLEELELRMPRRPNVKLSDLPDRLYEEMKIAELRQVSFRKASALLGFSKSWTLAMKSKIALDGRFELRQSESHKQKLLIRIKEDGKKIEKVEGPKNRLVDG